MEKLLLKPSEVAQILGIGRSLIYELIARREIPSIRLGRCIRIPNASLQRWIREQELKVGEFQGETASKEAGWRFTAAASGGGKEEKPI